MNNEGLIDYLRMFIKNVKKKSQFYTTQASWEITNLDCSLFALILCNKENINENNFICLKLFDLVSELKVDMAVLEDRLMTLLTDGGMVGFDEKGKAFFRYNLISVMYIEGFKKTRIARIQFTDEFGEFLRL